MARPNGTQRPTVTVRESNGVPPPSTIAAQIVSNHGNANARREPEKKLVFGQLLQEYLKDPSSAEEPDVLTNAQLVAVVAEAGLGSINDDPFALAALMPQAMDSINVIDLIIRRTPSLLTFRVAKEDGTAAPPVLVTLLPRIISLIGRRGLEQLGPHCASLLATCHRTLEQIRTSSEDAKAGSFFESCIEAVLAAVESISVVNHASIQTFKVSLPSSASIAGVWPESERLVALPEGCQIVLLSAVQALTFAVTVASVLPLSLKHDKKILTTLRQPQILSSCVEWCSRVWRCFVTIEAGGVPMLRSGPILVGILRTMFFMLSMQRHSRRPNTWANRMATTISNVLSQVVLNAFTGAASSDVAIAAVQVLLEFLRITRAGTDIPAISKRQLLATEKLALSMIQESLIRTAKMDSQARSTVDQDVKIALRIAFGDVAWLREAFIESFESDVTIQDDSKFQRSILQQQFGDLLDVTEDAWDIDHERPTKRIRLSSPHEGGTAKSPYTGILEHWMADQESWSTVHVWASSRYIELDDTKRLSFLRALSILPCAATSSLTEPGGHPFSPGNRTCTMCDTCESIGNQDGADPGRYFPEDSENFLDLITTLQNLTELSRETHSTRCRVLITTAVKRLIRHTASSNHLDLFESILGKWCLKSLTSSVRELRLTAGRSVVEFLKDHIPEMIRSKNRREALKFFKTISERNDLGEQETLIIVWSQLARICGDDELNLALLYLIDCLGHSNALISGTAYNEFSSLADELGRTPSELFRPFWSSIAISIVQSLPSRPQKAQLVADLLSTSVNELLVRTQGDTVAYLVLTKRHDVLRRIAGIRGPHTTIKDVCAQSSRILATILALLMCQPVADVEQATMELLTETAPEFSETTLTGLVCAEPILVACEMLKRAADTDDAKKSPVYHGFQTLAMLSDQRKERSKTNSKRSKALYTFFENHILGIMAQFTAILDSPRDPRPFVERRQCLGAIQEMIKLAKEQVGIALPQIQACLQCALAEDQLCDRGFVVWTYLVRALNEEDLDILIEPTMSVIAQYWTRLSAETQAKAHDLIQELFKDKSGVIKEHIDTFPSLASIPLLSKFEGEISRRKTALDPGRQFEAFARRLRDESIIVVTQALRELIPFFERSQQVLHESANNEKTGQTISKFTRYLLDACVRFGGDAQLSVLCAKALGLVGCLDPNRIEAKREKKEILVLSNFERAAEGINFTAFLLEHVLVKAFHSAASSRAQGFLAYAMQELLRFGRFHEAVLQKSRNVGTETSYQRWLEMSDSARNTLMPFLSSMYRIQNSAGSAPDAQLNPIFSAETTHAIWLRTFTFNLLQKGKGENAMMLFGVLARVIRVHDLSIASFMLPYAALNVVIGGSDKDVTDMSNEMLAILEYEREEGDTISDEDVKQCSENVFQVLDYLSRWLQEKRRALSDARVAASRGSRMPAEIDEIKEVEQISSVEQIFLGIPAEIISRRAVECGSYARALFHWEQYIRQERETAERSDTAYDPEPDLQQLQHIYSQIDEPDSIEGISAHLHDLDPAQQVLEHRKAGRWTAAQSWYEMELAQDPLNEDLQVDLLTCLKESGQYDSLLNYVDGFRTAEVLPAGKVLPFAAEAAWVTGKWAKLERILADATALFASANFDFNIGLGKALMALRASDDVTFRSVIVQLQEDVVQSLSPSTTNSIEACHDHLLRLHVLYEVEAMSGSGTSEIHVRDNILPILDARLDILGAYTSDKQYVLGTRRAVMQLSRLEFTTLDQASAWLSSAKLARRSELSNTAYNAVLHAAQMGDQEAKIEHSKLLWKDGHQRKAIQTLSGAIRTDSFRYVDDLPMNESAANVSVAADPNDARNRLTARANLLLTKWLDQGGQTQSSDITKRYQNVIKSYAKWDKCHYYLGKHYNKILEAEKALPRSKQSSSYISGEHAKLVIENFTRSMVYGAKHYFQTVPRVLTLWLDLGMEIQEATRRATAEPELANMRNRNLTTIHKHLQKYAIERLPPYVWYLALPQIITRISHPHPKVWETLCALVVKISAAHPQQALWSLLAVVKSTSQERAGRGQQVLVRLREMSKKQRVEDPNIDLRSLITQGQRLSEALLAACEITVDQRTSRVSLSKELAFNMKLAPCQLVVPIEATMIASLPSVRDYNHVRRHHAFPRDAVTIQAFEDDVLVLSSLQRPRKLTIRGSDGKHYGLLCKPKDDLRKDQRLMEFNGMINRALSRDNETSKRQLYIKTYGVTPLNEECGTIEWIENLKAIRDVIIRLYRQKNINIDYGEIRTLLARACENSPQNTHLFTTQILKQFPAVLHEWFLETFPDPVAWLASRHRYSRSTAVMSIVGHILGLGDRHGENVLLDSSGGIFHVDFNCLFDKGLTFEKPELVPFRLTHNMLDAMGPASVEGLFRIAAEQTLRICRANTDTLMTILETFVWDPTADFLSANTKRRKPRTGVGADVPDTPQEVLDAVRNKLRGLMKGDSVPLGVEGYVDALIQQARDETNLANMYIGWCAFF